jgi:hypothetical protein
VVNVPSGLSLTLPQETRDCAAGHFVFSHVTESPQRANFVGEFNITEFELMIYPVYAPVWR